MKYLGKLVGGLLGLFATRNPIGCGVGIAMGHAWDAGWLTPLLPGATPHGAFLEPLFGLAGAVAKADGRVSTAEIEGAERLMRRLDLDESKRQLAIRSFNAGKETEVDVRDATQRLRVFAGFRAEMKLMVIEVLAEIGAADGHLHRAGDSLLARIATDIGVDRDLAASILHARRPPGSAWHSEPGGPARGGNTDTRGRGPSRPPLATPPPDPYQILGVARSDDEDTIRRAYRKKMTQHHPDKMQARGVAGEALVIAEATARTINAAWEQIKLQRGFN